MSVQEIFLQHGGKICQEVQHICTHITLDLFPKGDAAMVTYVHEITICLDEFLHHHHVVDHPPLS